ncbi:Fluoroquinolones export ATP-binding protein [Mycobacteroides abscessus subsp. abscessus]|nr:Fluoroquinolones export ATP-binding protein [Mycobacteroides abscessus subsp. abscessus]
MRIEVEIAPELACSCSANSLEVMVGCSVNSSAVSTRAVIRCMPWVVSISASCSADSSTSRGYSTSRNF